MIDSVISSKFINTVWSFILFESESPVVYGWVILSLDQEHNNYSTRTEHTFRSMFRWCCVRILLMSKCSDRREIVRIGLISKHVLILSYFRE